MGYYVDTSAWVEYFRGTSLGIVAAQFIEGGEQIFTHTLVVAELRRFYMRNQRSDFDDHLAFIQEVGDLNSRLDLEIAILSGSIRQTEAVTGTSLIDCIQVALARWGGHRVLAKDTQFQIFQEGLVLGNL